MSSPSRPAWGRSGIIDGDRDCRPWVAPTMRETPPTAADRTEAEADPEELERIRRAAYEEGRGAGYEEGLRLGRRDAESEGRRIAAIADLLAAPLADLDREVVAEVARLACVMARHIVRREIALDEGVVVAAVERAVASLPLAARDVRIHLHPDDLTVVERVVTRDGGEAPWRLVGDPSIERGGCRVETESSEVDATVERRLNALFYASLGGTRNGDGDVVGD